MSAASPSELKIAPTDREKAAMTCLLADEDAAVFESVRARIVAQGAEAAQWLRPHALSNDPILRRRARAVLAHFDRQMADAAFMTYCASHAEDIDIEEAVWLLARTEFPEINVEGYRAWLDQIAARLFDRLDYSGEPDQIIGTVNQFLFQELGFRGNETNYYEPENSFLNRVLDRRTGNPINLSLVYLLVARRLRLPVAGIGMPGHFVCRFQSTTAEIYIDVFNRGRLLTKSDCVKFLLQSTQGFHEAHLAPVSPRRMLLRICMNLHHIYLQAEDRQRAARFQAYLVVLST